MAAAESFAAPIESSSSERHEAMPVATFSMGRGTPITPVEQTSTSRDSTARPSATNWAIFCTSSSPRVPVHAFAFPLFTTKARTACFPETMFWSHTTGAALTTFVVKAPATAAGTSEVKTVISNFFFLIPAATEPARNPFGARTPPSILFMFQLLLYRGKAGNASIPACSSSPNTIFIFCTA